jgi:hypothetical protein
VAPCPALAPAGKQKPAVRSETVAAPLPAKPALATWLVNCEFACGPIFCLAMPRSPVVWYRREWGVDGFHNADSL